MTTIIYDLTALNKIRKCIISCDTIPQYLNAMKMFWDYPVKNPESKYVKDLISHLKQLEVEKQRLIILNKKR